MFLFQSKLAAAESKARDSNVMTAECTQLQDENDRIRKELDIYRDKYYSRQYSSSIDPVRKAVPSVSQSFNQQVPVSQDVFKLVFSNSSTPSTNYLTATNKFGYKLNGAGTKIVNKPVVTDNGILNSVENFQAIQQGIPNPQRAQEEKSVLALPGMQKSSSTTTTTTESSKAEKRNDNLKAPPMIQSPTDKLSSAVSTKKQLPNGVVPIPESSLLDGNGAALDEQIEQNLKDVKIDLLNANEQENLGHEMQDGDLNIDNNNDKKSHADNNHMGIENNAEEDTNNYLNDNRQIFGNIGKDSDHSNKLKDDKQLNNEIQDDLGKEGENYADIRLDGQADEDGDIGEYDDLKAMKVQGPAERN